MNYCSNCGNKVEENHIYCLNCGVKLKNDVSENSNNHVDDGGFVWGILGFFVPMAGLILYLVWRNERPKTAKKAGKGALFSVIFYIALVILFLILAFSSSAVSENNYNNGFYRDDYYEDYYGDLFFD